MMSIEKLEGKFRNSEELFERTDGLVNMEEKAEAINNLKDIQTELAQEGYEIEEIIAYLKVMIEEELYTKELLREL